MGNNMNDDLDQRMTAWLDSVAQGCSEDTRFSLLSSALDAFLERFEQENGPISAIGSGNVATVQRLEPQPRTDERQPGTVETAFSTASVELEYGSDIDAPRPRPAVQGAETSMVVPSTQPSIGVPSTFSTFLPGVTSDRQQTENRLKRKRKHDCHKHECHAARKKAKQDLNNNYSSLDARLEQFYVCSQTNCLIPKHPSMTDSYSVKSVPDSAVHSSNKVRNREENAKHRIEKAKNRQEKPRLSRYKKESSLLKAATIRCLIRKALETGTYCCYRRCFLARPVLYV